MLERFRNRKTDPKFAGASRRIGSATSTGDIQDFLDPLEDTTTLASGTQRLVNPGQIIENIRAHMERIDLEPSVDWTLEDAMSADEADLMIGSLRMGPTVISATAWNAREILSARWPLHLVESPIAPEARIEMFTDVITVSEQGQLVSKDVLCRALASPTEIHEYPELEGVPTGELSDVWVGLMLWFSIKSSALNQHA